MSAWDGLPEGRSFTAASPPTRADLLDWLKLTDPGTGPDDDYDTALAAALDAQAARCDVTEYTTGLHRAALRRAAQELASQGMSLGVFDTGEIGTTYIPRWHTMIETEEMPHRLENFA